MSAPPWSISSISANSSLSSAAANTIWGELLTLLNNLAQGTNTYARLIGETQSLTIATGAVTATKMFAIIDTESSASSDDLDTINGYGDGRLLFVRAANSGRVVTLKNGTGNFVSWGGGDLVLSSTKWLMLIGNSTGWTDSDAANTLGAQPGLFQGRLTLTSATPITTSDVTAAANVYVTPFRGNRVSIYNSTVSKWQEYTFSEITVSLSGQAADTNYDVFLYISSGAVAAQLVAWTDATTRATALTTQDGVYVKNGATNYLYVGTIRTTSTIGQCEDSKTKRFVWNYYNRAFRNFEVKDTTNSWTYATNTWHSLNASTSNRFQFVRGVSEEPVSAEVIMSVSGTITAAVGWGLDSTSSPSGIYPLRSSNASADMIMGTYEDTPSAGYHYLQALEITSGATATFYGDNGLTYAQTGCKGRMAA